MATTEEVAAGSTRRLTPRGQELFITNLSKYQKDYNKAWKAFENILLDFDENASDNDIRYLREMENRFQESRDHLTQSAHALIAILERTGTDQSAEELTVHLDVWRRSQGALAKFQRQIQNLLLDAAEVYTEKLETQYLARSNTSSTISLLQRKRAKANAQLARLPFLEKEIEYKKQMAELEADILLVKSRETAAALQEEVKTLECEEITASGTQEPPGLHKPVSNVRKQFTIDYVNGKSHFTDEGTGSFAPNHRADIDENLDTSVKGCDIPDKYTTHVLNHTAQEYVPFQNATMTNLTQFLLKKDLLLTRFNQFNDRADTYPTWKASFKGIIKELNVTPFEEMDLLIKWLGPESRKFASSIRTSNINYPTRGLVRIWERLEDRYGRPEMVEAALKNKLNSFPNISPKDPKKLYDLLDILTEIESAKEDIKYSTLLSYFDSSSGVLTVVSKLPRNMQDKWVSQAAKYKKSHYVPFPPFTFFVEFIRDLSKTKNDPALQCEPLPDKKEAKKPPYSQSVYNRKTELNADEGKASLADRCPIHRSKHTLKECRDFKQRSLSARKEFLRENGICFKCCLDKHLSRNCKADVKCDSCGSLYHATAMHLDKPKKFDKPPKPEEKHGGEAVQTEKKTEEVSNKCTELCGQSFSGRSCAKIVPVRVYPYGRKDDAMQVYADIDEQSNRTLAKSELFDYFNLQSESLTYTLYSCSDRETRSGRITHNLVVESMDGENKFALHSIIECDDLPNNRQEIATPEVAAAYPHLRDIVHDLLPLDEGTSILLLIGRDLPAAHHVIDQKIATSDAPYAHRLHFGWVVVGDVCLGDTHQPNVVVANKVNVLSNGRTTLSEPCSSRIDVKHLTYNRPHDATHIGQDIFRITAADDKPGLSIEDLRFLSIMDKEFHRDDSGQWVAPLPFRFPRPRLPNNREHALRRALSLGSNLKRNPIKCEHAVAFMKRIIDAGHAEPAPSLKDTGILVSNQFSVYIIPRNRIKSEWYLIHQLGGVSLNKVLLSGPDLVNSLIGVLMRFRLEQIGIMADIQQMFHCSKVRKDHQNFLRFLWYTNNDPKQPLIDYRMRVHVFGNTTSPVVASYGLKKTAVNAEAQFGSDVRSFVDRNFYVDDGLISLPTAKEAVSLMRRTQKALLQEGGLRLHKIASNSKEVMSSFPSDDLAKDITSLDLIKDNLPVHRSLGLIWDLRTDSFTFRISPEDKPYTRRGLLSCLNSFYDPLGFVAPVLIRGKLLLRNLTSDSSDWDQPLPEAHQSEWDSWKQELQCLETLQIPRSYFDVPSAKLSRKEVHVFTDASEEAIASVAYLVTRDIEDNLHKGFIIGKAKVAPKSGVTIPRLELCAAVLGVEIAEIVSEQLDLPLTEFHYHTDSKVVLGYIYNVIRIFYTYVSNGVQRIRKSSNPEQWGYVPTEQNPADQATRSLPAKSISKSSWLLGPSCWPSCQPVTVSTPDVAQNLPDYDLVDSQNDKEIRPLVSVNKVIAERCSLSTRFAYISNWNSLVRSIAFLKHIARYWQGQKCHGWHYCESFKDRDLYAEAEKLIIRDVQLEVFSEEILCIKAGQPLAKGSPIIKLNPILDSEGILRVGGRLSKSGLNMAEKTPIIIPGKHHVATLGPTPSRAC